MTIENKANYENMSYKEDTLYIYCHGFFSPKEVEFLRELTVLAAENVEFCTGEIWIMAEFEFSYLTRIRYFPD